MAIIAVVSMIGTNLGCIYNTNTTGA